MTPTSHKHLRLLHSQIVGKPETEIGLVANFRVARDLRAEPFSDAWQGETD